MSIMEVVKKVNKKYYLFIIYLNFSFIMLSTRMDNHRQNIRKEFPVKEYQVIRNPDDFFQIYIKFINITMVDAIITIIIIY